MNLFTGLLLISTLFGAPEDDKRAEARRQQTKVDDYENAIVKSSNELIATVGGMGIDVARGVSAFRDSSAGRKWLETVDPKTTPERVANVEALLKYVATQECGNAVDDAVRRSRTDPKAAKRITDLKEQAESLRKSIWVDIRKARTARENLVKAEARLAAVAGVKLQADGKDVPPVNTPPKSWREIVPPSNKPNEKQLFTSVKTLEFNGIGGDRNNIQKLTVDGSWELSGAALQRIGGTSAAVSFGVAKDFEFEGRVDYGNEGGSFFLLGWKGTSGYLIQEIGLRKSAGWVLSEVRDGNNVPATNKHLNSAKVRGDCPIVMSISDKKLKMKVASNVIADDVGLPNYVESDIIIGTYPSGYGPRPLRIISARIRAD